MQGRRREDRSLPPEGWGWWTITSAPTIRLPFVALACALLAVLVHVLGPVVGRWLEFDRALIAGGEIWRVITGHLVHESGSHLFWDVIAFAGLGLALEWASPRRFLRTIALSALAVSGAVFFLRPDVLVYRGLSGIDSGLFTALIVGMIGRAFSERRLGELAGLGVLTLGFGAKLTFESLTGSTFFVSGSASDHSLVLAHVAGAMAGAIAMLSGGMLRSRPTVRNR